MKGLIMTGKGPVVLNGKYLKTVGRMYTYYYIPNEEVTADLLRSVGDEITSIDRYNDTTWQVQVRTESIKWEE